MSASGPEALASRHCVPCRGGVPPLGAAAIEEFLAKLPDWRAVKQHHLEKTFRFPDFAQGLDFVNRIGAVAEAEGHHPDLCLRWGSVRVEIFTHVIDGLTESDFILAAKIDEISGAGP